MTLKTGNAPSAASEPTTPGDNGDPQTGDSSNIALWIAVLFVSGGVLSTLTIKRVRKKQR